MPVSVSAAFGLVTVNVNGVVEPIGTLPAANFLVSSGGPLTVSVAVSVAVLPPPSVDVTLDMVLANDPAAVAIAMNWNVQDSPWISVTPDIVKPPGGVLNWKPGRLHPLMNWFGIRLGGTVAENAMPCRSVDGFGLVSVKRSVVKPFLLTVSGVNDTSSAGGATALSDFAFEVMAVPAIR